VVTGRGTVDGRPAIVVANDPTVKAGSWGARTVEKIVRATESALREELPVFWFVDSAGARITDQVEMFPGRRGAGPHLPQPGRAVRQGAADLLPLRARVPAGGAYIPSFTDIVIMVEGNASMYLGSPRMAEMVVGERVSLEEMGGARMHCTVSGCGDLLAQDDVEAIELAKLYFSYVPGSWREPHPRTTPRSRPSPLTREVVPERESVPFDVHEVIDGLVDDGSFFEIKPLFAAELVVGFGRMGWRDGRVRRNNSRSRAACSSPTAPTRRPGSSGSATRSRSRSSTSPTCPAS
jgi:acetyl-CoA carboxylase carboxyltransferase component